MPLLVYDGASPFSLTAAKAHSGVAVTVYIRGTPGGFAHADKARVDAARALGLGVSPNWEATADFFGTCSIADARAAGIEAVGACIALGFPANGSIAVSFSFDFDVPSNRFAEMGQKVRAITAGMAGLYQTMVYAPQALIDYLVKNSYVGGKHWLMMSTFNHPYDPSDPNVCMVQEHDAAGNWFSSPVPGTDVNTLTDPYALNAWWPAGSPYARNPIKEFLMSLTDAQQTEVYQVLHFLGDAFQVNNSPVLRKQGEFGEALRSLRDNFSHLATDDDLSKLPKAPSAADITNAVVAALPGVKLTPEDVAVIAAAVAAEVAKSAPTAFVVESKVTSATPPTA